MTEDCGVKRSGGTGLDGVGAEPGEKSAECLCRGVGPSINIGPYAITRGRGQRRGSDGNDATWGLSNNNGELGCQHDDNNNCDSRPPLNQNPSVVVVACC